jgi:MFS family permease
LSHRIVNRNKIANDAPQKGLIVGAPFLALADVVGRRGINFTGNAIVIFAALLQGFSPNLKMCTSNGPLILAFSDEFLVMAGRFFLGFGCALMSSPQYMGEIAPCKLAQIFRNRQF